MSHPAQAKSVSVNKRAPQPLESPTKQHPDYAANDWITGWTDAKGKLWFDLEVATAGSYEIELAFASLPGDAGSRLRISVGSEALEAIIPPASAPEILLPNRDEEGKTRYRNREWGTLKAGALKFPAGPAKITLEPLTMLGAQVMDFKHLKLNLHSAP